ncbi:MAG TPA: lysylphosphatidylglycerol synthase transmembrane domain-containing protein, partial [Gaiellaceae bacterium]
LALVASRIDFGAAGDRLSGGRWGYFAAAVAALFASFVVGALRWHVLLNAAGIESPRAQTIRAYLIGMFTTNFLPTQIGGDVTRAWIAGRRGLRVRTAATVVVDRASALVCLVVVAWLALAADPGPVPGFLIGALGAATTFLVIVALVAAVLLRRGTRLGPWTEEARRATRACLRAPVVRTTLTLGLVFQGLVVLALWLLARAIVLGAPFSVLAVVLPPVLIATTLPISIAGFGVREGMFALLLRHANVDTTDATLLSLLSAAAFAVASLPGGLVLLRR